jgi:hypothetical protein
LRVLGVDSRDGFWDRGKSLLIAVRAAVEVSGRSLKADEWSARASGEIERAFLMSFYSIFGRDGISWIDFIVWSFSLAFGIDFDSVFESLMSVYASRDGVFM